MLEGLQIRIFGRQPSARISDEKLERLITREYGDKTEEVKLKLKKTTGDTKNGRNRISAAILKLSNKDINTIDYFIEMSNNDFRDVISRAEYPRCSQPDFKKPPLTKPNYIYLEDWREYSEWVKGVKCGNSVFRMRECRNSSAKGF